MLGLRQTHRWRSEGTHAFHVAQGVLREELAVLAIDEPEGQGQGPEVGLRPVPVHSGHHLGHIRIELKGVAAVDGHDRVLGNVGQEKFVFAALGRLQAEALLSRLRIGIEHGASPTRGPL